MQKTWLSENITWVYELSLYIQIRSKWDHIDTIRIPITEWNSTSVTCILFLEMFFFDPQEVKEVLAINVTETLRKLVWIHFPQFFFFKFELFRYKNRDSSRYLSGIKGNRKCCRLLLCCSHNMQQGRNKAKRKAKYLLKSLKGTWNKKLLS